MTNQAGRSDEQGAKEVRFRKELRERKLRDGTTDRFWCVVDREQKGFIVLRVCGSYAGSELLAGAYALKLNSRDADAASRLPTPATPSTPAGSETKYQPREWSKPHLRALDYLNNCLLDDVSIDIGKLREILDVPDQPEQTFEEWWQQNGPGDENISFRRIRWVLTLMKNMCELAWNAAKSSSPVVAGGESESDETRTAIALDRQFLAGMSLGWNLGVVEDREEFNRRLDSGYKAIRDAKAELKDVRGKEDWSANDDAHMDAQDKLRGGTR